MKKKRIMAAGLAVIMAFTGTGCQKILKGEPAETTSKESQEADAATKESVNESERGAEESENGPETEENAESKKRMTVCHRCYIPISIQTVQMDMQTVQMAAFR